MKQRMLMVARLMRITTMAMAATCLLVGSSAGQQETAAPAVATAETAAYTAPPSRVPEAERMRLRDGLAAAERTDWTGLMQLRDSASDPLVRRMLQWRLATSAEAPLYFSDLRNALNDLQGWPGRTNMRARAEQAILAHWFSAARRRPCFRRRPHRAGDCTEGHGTALGSHRNGASGLA
jgi:soluble lytic murein transglycosylase